MTRRELVAKIEAVAAAAHANGERLKYNEAFGMVTWNAIWCRLMQSKQQIVRKAAGMELERLSGRMQRFLEACDCSGK